MFKNRPQLDRLQKISMSLMAGLMLLTFVGANLQALLWQSSDWLVSTVLPAVVVDLTNDERADIAAAPLQRNATLDAAAKLKAQDMADNEYFAHFSPKGVSPWFWFDEAGYVYAHAGENLAIHFTDSTEVVEAWMKSPTHRGNIVDKKYTEIGVGTAKGKYEGYNTVYVVQLFGTPAVTPLDEIPTPTPTPELAQVDTLVSEEALVIHPTVFDVALEVPELSPTELVIEQVEIESSIPTAVLAAEEDLASVAQEHDSGDTSVIETPVLLSKDIKVPVNPEDIVIVESPVISTSSGLAVANITTFPNKHAGATVASIATKPSLLLQSVYLIIAFAILVMLSISIVTEARKFHYMQVAYGFMLMFAMGGLWFVHSLLTTGAVIV